jgi:glycine/D-amino acid oxidase-like deaminating enzyme/nitrite reductase/ring-hydroxylating ferredoxin subunit
MARHQSYWNATAPASAFPALSGTLEVDVAVIGGGMVGTTVVRLLKDRGLTVALVEARRIGEEVTGKSTAKITSQHNIHYTILERKFGEDGARLYAEANQTGLATIRTLAERHGISCNLETRPAFTYTRDEAEVGTIEQEVALARRLGLPASLTEETGLPFPVRRAMRWDDQAQFHPVRYLKGLAETIPGDGCHVFEGSRVTDWDAHRIATDAGEVRARSVVMATHLPLGQTGLFYTENYPHMHPVIMGRAEAGRVPQGMYISVEQPRHSTRGHRDDEGADWMIFTGPSFTHGNVEEERKAFAEIEGFARDHFGVGADYRWTNEDYQAMDKSPFVGWASSIGQSCLVATGFNAWGITNGTAAAILIADLIQGRDNPWLKVFDATRIKPVAGGKDFLTHNAAVAGHLVGGWLGRKLHSYEDLGPGEAAVLKVGGRNVGAYRDEQGRLHAVSAVCTHMGCMLGWNETDRSWDCNCHGSRFACDGSVIHGPAVTALEVIDAKETAAAEGAG